MGVRRKKELRRLLPAPPRRSQLAGEESGRQRPPLIHIRHRTASAALGVSLALVISATAAGAQEGAPVRLRDLVGLDAAGVQARLGGEVPAPSPGLTALSTAGGVVEMTDAISFGGSTEGGPNCSLRMDPQPPMLTSWPILVFRGGRMVGAVRLSPPRPIPGPSFRDGPQALNAYMRAPLQNVAVAAAGELPLQRGVEAFLAALGPPLPEDAGFVRVCRPRLPPRVVTPGVRSAPDTAGLMQGLALLPFAVALPGLNAERRRARDEGPRTLAEIHLGDRLEGGGDGFAARHRGVFAESRDDYAVLVINMGAAESNNLSRMNSAAFVGLRGGRVEWILPSQGWPYGLLGIGLCESADRRPTSRRRGCTDYGYFSP